MNSLKNEKGVIAVALSFIIVIALVVGVLTASFRRRAPVTASNIKRFQAADLAEAAMYEVFNRFRRTDAPFDEWDSDLWAAGTGPTTTTYYNAASDTTFTFVNSDGDPVVRFDYGPVGFVDAVVDVVQSAGPPIRNKVKITIDQSNLRLERT